MSNQANRLGDNLVHFARLLRRAGIPVGPAETIAASQALAHIDLGSRRETRSALQASMVHRREHHDLFEQAFALFWRDPDAARQAAALSLLDGRQPKEPPRPGARRITEAMAPPRPREEKPPAEPPRLEVALTSSGQEQLQAMDFEQMTAEQVAAAKAQIRRLTLPLDRRRTRRHRPAANGPRPDLAATIRRSLREGGDIVDLQRTAPVTRPPPLVVLCDISGSMARYAQILLHFLHAVVNERERVHVFLFGTRLSNVTRQLRNRDPEVAFQLVSHLVPDWSGGTRIGDAVAEFNQRWGRRVLAQGAVVLLVSDGLDRPTEADGLTRLSAAMDRLHRSCRRLIWLNPLLRWSGFQPKSASIRAILPHVDEFRTVHNLDSLRDLVALLSRPAPARGGRTMEGFAA